MARSFHTFTAEAHQEESASYLNVIPTFRSVLNVPEAVTVRAERKKERERKEKDRGREKEGGKKGKAKGETKRKGKTVEEKGNEKLEMGAREKMRKGTFMRVVLQLSMSHHHSPVQL